MIPLWPDGRQDAQIWRHRALIGASCLLVFMAAATGCSRPNAAPAVASIAFVGTPAKGDTYELGERVEVVVEFDREVVPTGTPRVALTIGEETRHATFSGWNVSRSVYSELSFNYTVQAADRDEDGISIPANALILDSGTIIRGSEGADADLTHAAVATERGRKVDGSSVSPPAVKEISFGSSPLRGDTYGLTDTILVSVYFHKAVTMTGDAAHVALNIGGRMRYATVWAGGVAGRRLQPGYPAVFSYTVQKRDRDRNGISIPANALILNGGTIKHAADRTIDADLTHDAVAADPNGKVNGRRARPRVNRRRRPWRAGAGRPLEAI